MEVVPAGGDEAGARALLGTFARSVASTNATTTALAADTSLPGEPADVLDEVEFRSSLRWSGITLADGTALVLGAPSTVRPALADAAAVSDDAVRRRTGEGLRVLVLARGEGALHDADGRPRLPRLRAVALVALADELREGVTDVLTGLAAEGVAVKVVSGDDPDTVAALARRAGLDAPAMAGPALAGSRGPTPTPSTTPSTPTGSSGGSPRSRRSRSSRRWPAAGARWRWWATASTTPARSSARRSGWRCARAAR